MYFMYAYAIFMFLTFLLHFYGNVSGISGSFYADNGSGQSVLYRTLAKNDKVELQKEILKLLDLKQRPKRSLSTKQGRNYFRESSSKKYLLRLYRAVGDNKARKKFCRKNKACMELLTSSDFIISYSNKIDEFSPLERQSSNRFFFDVSNINSDWAVVKAELRIFRNFTERSEVHQGKKFLVSLFALLDDEPNNEKLELVEDFIISNESSRRWFTFNVTTVLKKWNKFPFSNYGLILKVKPSTLDHGYEISPYDFGISTDGPNEFKAFMVAYFKSSSQQRLRAKRAPRRKHSSCSKGIHNPYRSPPPLRYVPSARSCEKWTLYVNFRDLGFDDWIIAPDGYGAFFCDGSCMFPLNAQMNATNHAIVQTLMHLMDPSGVPKPSCAPTQLSSITVLYFDDNSNVILKRYKNMVVKSCGCH